MKYNIIVNQFAIVESGIDIDIIDAAILDCMVAFFNSKRCVSMTDDFGTFFWVSHQNIIDNLPLINIKSKSGIKKRIEKLVSNKLLAIHPSSRNFGRSYYKIGDRFHELNFSKEEQIETKPRPETTPPSPQKGEGWSSKGRGASPQKGEDYNTNNYNINYYKEKTTQKGTETEVSASEHSKKKNNRSADEFEKLWKMYERRGSKKVAKAAWMKLDDRQAKMCIAYASAIVKGIPVDYRRHLERVIQKELWEGKVVRDGKCVYDPESVEDSIDLNEEPRKATMYPKSKSGAYVSLSEHPLYDTVYDGYTNDNRPDKCRLIHCGLLYEWDKENKKFKEVK